MFDWFQSRDPVLQALLAPAIEIAETGPTPSWFPPAVGFLLGNVDLATVSLLLGFVVMMVLDVALG